MATVRTLSVALLLTLCFAACACACAAAALQPTNRYISYVPVPVPHARGGNGGVRRGCSALTKCAGRQPPSLHGRRPPNAGATTTAAAAVSQTQGLAASRTASTKGGANKAFAAGPKVDYITKP